MKTKKLFSIYFQAQVIAPAIFVLTKGSDVYKKLSETMEDYFDENHPNSDFLDLLTHLKKCKKLFFQKTKKNWKIINSYSPTDTYTYFTITVAMASLYLIACVMDIVGAYIVGLSPTLNYELIENSFFSVK